MYNSVELSISAARLLWRLEGRRQIAAEGPGGLADQRGAAHWAEGVDQPILRPDCHLLAAGEVVEEGDGVLRCEVLKEHVVDLDHRRVDARAEALDLREGEEAVGARLARLDAEVGLDRVPVWWVLRGRVR